jgi:hypothetical protein
MLGSVLLAQVALLSETWSAVTATDGNTFKLTGPAIVKFRPVASFTEEMMSCDKCAGLIRDEAYHAPAPTTLKKMANPSRMILTSLFIMNLFYMPHCDCRGLD